MSALMPPNPDPAARPPGSIELEFEPTPEAAAEFAQRFREEVKKSGPLRVLPPSAVEIRRRSPEERRRYLTDHRDEAIAKGIPSDLIDMFIADAEGDAT